MAWVFGTWGSIVERCTLLVFIISLAGFGYAGYGLRHANVYSSKDFVFAPTVSCLNLIYLGAVVFEPNIQPICGDRATGVWMTCMRWKKSLAGSPMRNER